MVISIDWQSNSDNMNDDSREEYVVRARGLPWSASAENVAEFFSGKGFTDTTHLFTASNFIPLHTDCPTF